MIAYKRGFGVTSVLLLALLGSVSVVQGAPVTLFQDNFDTIRPSGTPTTSATSTLGNNWVEVNNDSNDVAIVDLSILNPGLQGAMRLRDEANSSNATDSVTNPDAAATQLSLSTVGFNTIKLSFDWRLIDSSPSNNDEFSVSWKTGSSTIWTTLFSTGLGGTCSIFSCNWDSELFSLGNSANDNAQIQLRFWTNVNSQDDGVLVDNVLLTGERIPTVAQAPADLPEPGTIALLGLGLAGLGFLKRRKA